MIEKSLRKSRPQFQPPPEEELPVIKIEDSRKLVDAGAGPSFFVKKIEIEGNTLFDDETLAPLVDIGEGLEMTLGVLSLYAGEVTAFYGQRGYILARAYIPEQEVKAGIVILKVVEGKVGKIEVTGNEKLKREDFLKRMEAVMDEKVLKERTLERVLLELNDLMGVQVRSVLKPGELPGTSDLVLEVTETRPYQISVDADNFGSRFTGRNRFGFTGSVGNLFKLGDQFSFRAVRSDQGQNFFQPSYLIPITSSGTVLKGSFTFSEHELGGSLSALKAGGSTTIYNLEVTQPLVRSRNLQVFARGGVEFRNFINKQFAQKTSDDKLRDFYVNLGGNYTDRFRGRTFFDLRTQFGYTESDINRTLNSRSRGRGDVTVINLNLVRYQSTSPKFFNSYFVMRMDGQIASSRVLSPDQISIGGVGTVRGYPLAELSGDDGYDVSLEFVLPIPWKTPVGNRKLTLDRVMSLVAFIDHGKVFVLGRQPGEIDQTISGAGGGVRINVPKIKPNDVAVSFALLYGIPVLGGPDPSDRSFGIFYLSGLMTY
ncbi:MAG: ShlB/FhaC/HecB family hemolysin secretion/activation protein [Nitrospinaceae bacterium]